MNYYSMSEDELASEYQQCFDERKQNETKLAQARSEYCEEREKLFARWKEVADALRGKYKWFDNPATFRLEPRPQPEAPKMSATT